MTEDNVALVRRWFQEVWNERRPETIDELMWRDAVCYSDDGAMRGPDEFKTRQYHPFLSAFPDLHVEVEATVAEDDVVVVRWKATGTHTEAGLGFHPSHQKVIFRGMSWIQLRDGKFAEGWQYSNIPEVIRSLEA